MSFTHVIRTFVLITLLLAAVAPIAAQDDSQNDHPLLELLSYVPDTDSSREEIYFADFRASAEAALGESQESTLQAWEALGYPDELWLGWLPFAVPQFAGNLNAMLEDKGQSTGLDVITIDRTLYFGQPPATATVLQGDFDTEAIVAAYTAETHEVQDHDSVTLLCSVDGCEDGLTLNPEQRNPANPFGGQLGRREPIALLDGLILNSPDISVLEAMVETGSGEETSLAESPDYQAAVMAASNWGVLRQAMFVGSESTLVREFSVADLTPEQQEALGNVVTPLPHYQLVMFADTADLDTQTESGLVLLVYDNEEDATAAIEALQSNLSQGGLPALNSPRSLNDLMTQRGTMNFEVVADDETGLFVAVFSLQASLVQPPDSDDTPPTFAGQQFRLFQNMAISLDVLWLAYEAEEE